MPAPLSPDYRLTIQFSLGGLSFVLFDPISLTVADMELHLSDSLGNSDALFHALEKDLNARDLTDYAFRSVTCLIDGRTHTLVPDELYQPEHKEKLLEFSFDLPDSYVTAADPVAAHQAHNIYAYPQSLHDRILQHWPQATVLHTSTVFLDSLSPSDVPTVHVNVRNRDFDMAIMHDRLLFFNNFKFQTKVDFSYYLLFAMQQHDLSGLETPVVFSGLIQPSSEIIELCRRYVKDLRLVTRPEGFLVKESFRDVPFQYYYHHYQILK